MENNIEVKNSTLDDVYKLLPHLRAEDILEMKKQGHSAELGLFTAYAFSDECFSVFNNNKIIAMFGLCTYKLAKGFGAIWFLGSDDLIKIPKLFLKEGRNFIKNCLNKVQVIFNIVDKENEVHIKFLEKLNMSFSSEIEINQNKFIQFYKIREE